jgi:predicted TIM-barrel fold metal-dependent hydrolase
MRIDVHGYIGKWPYWPVPQASPEEVITTMDKAGIDSAVITSTRSLFVNWRDGNAEASQAETHHPRRLISFACAGPPELSHKLDANQFDLSADSGIRGIRLAPQFQTYHLLYEPFIDDLCEKAAYLGIPVQLPLRVVMNWGMPMLDLGWIAAIVERHPRTLWILTGLNYFHELRVGLALMRRFPAVHVETSCIQGFEAIAKIVQEAGSDRILFGTGLPLQNAAAGVSKVQHARISDSDREAIFSGNARRLLKLANHYG